MPEHPESPTPDEMPSENTYFIKIGNTTFEIERHFSGTCTYTDIIKQALERMARNG